jgi:ABC-type Fe3+ transport system substrate-binding protein
MLRQALFAFLPLVALIAIPVAMRPPAEGIGPTELKLVIITPHNEAIRYEFEHAFNAYYQRTRGQVVAFDWRTPGGTSDIVRYLNDQYRTRFQQHWEQQGQPWSAEVEGAFNNAGLKLDDPATTAAQRTARETFLASEVGIGVDILFGGGQYDLKQQADKGHGVDAGIQRLHPDWFAPEVIPPTWSGEVFYDPQGRYYGACLSAFGICYNVDRVAQLADPTPPHRWADLGAPRFFGHTAVADPTKSGSINKCFEMLIQQTMAEAAAGQAKPPPETLAQGWAEGLNLIKRIGANARYLTDSAHKVPHDVGKGDTIAGMCIDFYGRAEAEWTGFQANGPERIVYVTPEGGSSLSADPIQLLRGAPNRQIAIDFIEFVLSPEGQRLWNYRVGTPGGPRQYALRRQPVRRDCYTPEDRQYMADGEHDPFAESADFVYRGGWTGPHFNLIRSLIKAMVLDAGPELRAAWGAILAAGGPEAVPAAMAEFNALPFAYGEARDAGKRLAVGRDGVTVFDALQASRGWAQFFRERYRAAQRLARQAPLAQR